MVYSGCSVGIITVFKKGENMITNILAHLIGIMACLQFIAGWRYDDIDRVILGWVMVAVYYLLLTRSTEKDIV